MSKSPSVTFIDPLDQISPNRAMAVFRLSRPFMAELIESGRVPAITVGKRRRVISIKALQAALSAPQQAA